VAQEFSGVDEIGFYHAEESDLKFFYPAVCGSPKFYADLQRRGAYYESEKFEFQVAEKYLPKGARILEVGCGDGAFAKTIALKSPEKSSEKSIDYVGLESNPEAVKSANACGLNVILRTVEDQKRLREPLFDAVCAFQVVEHVQDVRGFIQTMIDLLLPEGLLILSVPNDDAYIGKALNNLFNLPPHHVTRWSEKSLQNVAKVFSLKLLSLQREPLPKTQRHWFEQVMAIEAWRIKNAPSYTRVVDLRLRTRVAMKVATLLSSQHRKNLNPEYVNPEYGHTAVAIYQKPIDEKWQESLESKSEGK
jgi:2-polyprenyl-3-methyl-5-hydroxy-6-metoxy-1,4-benzoquinol methylase